jgi:NAD(P)-dependent dehydrogenase (short-subunit alcohol dehydrogenase family)
MATISLESKKILMCEDKVALVTGGGSGIGLAICRTLAHEGAAVVIVDVDKEVGEAARECIQKTGANALFVECDVSHAESVKAAVAATVETYGRLDCIVNNAAISLHAEVTDIDDDEFDRLVAINIRGVYLFIKHGIRQMHRQGSGGSIVNIASVGGVVGTPLITAYTMSKHAVVGLTRGVAVEQGHHGIRVNAVCPGPIHTEMLEEYVRLKNSTLDEFGAELPLRKIGQPQDVAEAVIWLCSNKSGNTTGSLIMVDGGYTAQ